MPHLSKTPLLMDWARKSCQTFSSTFPVRSCHHSLFLPIGLLQAICNICVFVSIVDELSVLSMASKGFSNAVFRELKSDRFVDRVVHLMSDVEGLSSRKILKKVSVLKYSSQCDMLFYFFNLYFAVLWTRPASEKSVISPPSSAQIGTFPLLYHKGIWFRYFYNFLNLQLTKTCNLITDE